MTEAADIMYGWAQFEEPGATELGGRGPEGGAANRWPSFASLFERETGCAHG
jgi:hypothetical protein